MQPQIDFSRRRRGEGCLSDLALDRLVTGEPAVRPDAAAVEAHLAGCAACTQRLEEFRHARLLAEPLLAAARRRAQRSAAGGARPRRRWLTAMVPVLAMAAALLVLLIPRLRPPGEGGSRLKGDGAPLGLDVVVRHNGGQVEPLAPSGRVRPGDMIRFLVSALRPGHLVVLGLDAAGKISVYVADGDSARPIERGARQVMPGSIILDGTLGAERLVALQCDARFPVAAAVDAGRKELDRASNDPRRVGPLGLSGCHEAVLLLEKSEPR